MALEREQQYYKDHKLELLKKHEGKFALIIGDELLGIFEDDESAYGAGLEARGNVPMLIREISRHAIIGFAPAWNLGLTDADLERRLPKQGS